MAGREHFFSSTDSWIFASLSGSLRAGYTLLETIRNADMLNHSIPTIDEVVGAVETLHAHGLIRTGKSRLVLTAHGQNVLANGRARRGGLFRLIDNIEKTLNSPVYDHPAISRQADTTFITPEAYSAACDEYNQQAINALK